MIQLLFSLLNLNCSQAECRINKSGHIRRKSKIASGVTIAFYFRDAKIFFRKQVLFVFLFSFVQFVYPAYVVCPWCLCFETTAVGGMGFSQLISIRVATFKA
jgi:hypothetical protein